MNEAIIRNEISEIIYSLGFVPYHPPDMRPMFGSKDGGKAAVQGDHKPRGLGRIDLIGANPIGETILIEAKAIRMLDGPRRGHNGTLMFKEISTSQRRTLDRWVYRLEGSGYLAIGTIESKRRLWIIPWADWVTQELLLFGEGFKGMPVFSNQHKGLDDLFPAFEVEWAGTKEKLHWKFPGTNHPITKLRSQAFPVEQWEAVSLRFEDVQKESEE